MSEGLYNPESEILMNQKQQIKTINSSIDWYDKLNNWLKKHLTILIIWVLVGMAIGFTISKVIYKDKMNEAVKLGGLIHNNLVYDVKLRP